MRNINSNNGITKFIQLESQIQLLIDLKINSELPLIEKTAIEK